MQNVASYKPHNATTVICRRCDGYVENDYKAMVAHAYEKTEIHNGAKITACVAKRISSDGP